MLFLLQGVDPKWPEINFKLATYCWTYTVFRDRTNNGEETDQTIVLWNWSRNVVLSSLQFVCDVILSRHYGKRMTSVGSECCFWSDNFDCTE